MSSREPEEPAVDKSEASHFVRRLIDSVEIGLGLVDLDTGAALLVNERLERWLDGGALSDFLARVPDLNWPAPDIKPGEMRESACEIKVGRRIHALALRITALSNAHQRLLAIEARDVSKLKELEYMMDSYAKMLERSERAVRREKERAEKLLLNIMPKQIFDEIRDVGVSTPQRYDACSVLMLDFVDFTEMAVAQDPSALVAELNDVFTAFDRIVEQFGCERIKTIGDAYIAVSGLPEASADHAGNIARVSLRMVRYLERRNAGQKSQWRCRIGISSGPVVGSMIGVHKFVYDIFGPGVNLAARLEAVSEPMQITVCDPMAAALRGEFLLQEIGEAELKGFGQRQLYRLIDEAMRR
jgi:adenylate cyclase